MPVELFLALLLGARGEAAAAAPCPGETTIEVNACMDDGLRRAQERLERYRQAAIDRYAESERGAAIILGIQAADRSAEAYRQTECATVYEDWKDGTIRGAMHLSCLIRLTDERTHTIWRNWLQYMDSTPPILPEPQPTP